MLNSFIVLNCRVPPKPNWGVRPMYLSITCHSKCQDVYQSLSLSSYIPHVPADIDICIKLICQWDDYFLATLLDPWIHSNMSSSSERNTKMTFYRDLLSYAVLILRRYFIGSSLNQGTQTNIIVHVSTPESKMLPAKKKLKKKTAKKLPHPETAKTAKPLFEFTPVPCPVPGEKLLAALQDWKKEREKIASANPGEDTECESPITNIRDLRIVFKCVNSNNTGFLNETELQNALELLGLEVNEGAKEHIKKIINSNRGSLSFDAFQKLVTDWNGVVRNFYLELKKGFAVIDTDQDGKITAEDLKEASKLAGIHFTNKELEGMLHAADQNGDHAVDIQEFVQIMLKTNLF
ncbi:uncharacterized protein PAF06_001123 [Gastrophryne carolinensis]